MEPAELQLAFFGGLSVSRGSQLPVGLTSQKALALLCYLALTGRPHSRPFLAGLLWGDMPENQALMNLRKALNQLRQTVGDHLIISRQQVAFNRAAPHRIDANAFASIAQAVSPDENLTGPQLERLEQSLSLYQGEFLEGFYLRSAWDFEQWVLGKRAYYHELALKMLAVVAAEHARQGRIKLAIDVTRQLLRLEPWRENAHRELMRLLALDGQRGAALVQYENCRRTLEEELGVDPSEETQVLYQAIQTGEFELSPLTQNYDAQIKPILPAFLNDSDPERDRAEQLFVGRGEQLALLEQHLEAARAGRGGVVWVSAEAGMGKTSLMNQFSRKAQESDPDLLVATGLCTTFTGKGDPYLPFREILRMLSCDLDSRWAAGEINRDHALRLWQRLPVVVEALVTAGRSLIDTFVPFEPLLSRALAHTEIEPDLTSQLEGLIHPRQGAGDNQERVFEEYTDVLSKISRTAPLLLIIDDLHWVDASSINLLFHLGRRLSRVPILIVGAFRPEDIYLGGEGQESLLGSVLNEFKRLFGNNELHLSQESHEKERQFVDALLDLEPNRLGEAFRAQLTRYTHGNPLFVVEMIREMQACGDLSQDEAGCWDARPAITWDTLPGRVEGVIEKRIYRLEPELREVLVTASVEGEEFTAEVISRIRKIDEDLLIRMLSLELAKKHHLVRARGVEQRGERRVTRYQFSHNLFQKYLYSTMDPVERVQQHRAVGTVLEDLHHHQTGEIALQLARHFLEAQLGMKAGRYLLLAGNEAARILAFDEAAMHFEHGLSELDHLDPTSETTRMEYELRLGLARALWQSGRVIEAVSAFKKTIEIARSLGDSHALANAVLSYEEPRWRLNLDTQLTQQFLREALAALDGEQSGLRVRLLVGLSRSLLSSGDQDELRATVDQALHLARRINDPIALCDTLRIKIQIDRRPESTAGRLAAIQEMITTAESIGDQERLADGLDLYVYDLLELGQIDRVDKMMDAQRQVAQEIKQPFQLHIAAVFQTMRSILRGEFEAAERFSREAADLSRKIGVSEIDGIFGIHMFTIWREQGRLNEIAPFVKLIVDNNPKSSAWRPGLALIFSILNQRKECQAIFDDLASDGFASIPQDSLWVSTLSYLSEVCAFLGEADQAAILYQWLLPYDGRTVVVGGATACFGAAARYLGMLAVTMSEWDSAEQHFQDALEQNEQMEAWPWLAHTQYEYAAMLTLRGRAQSRERASDLLNQSLNSARRMGMEYLAQKVVALQAHYEFASS